MRMIVNFILLRKSLRIYYESSIRHHAVKCCSGFLIWLAMGMTQQAEKGIQIHDQPIKHMLGL